MSAQACVVLDQWVKTLIQDSSIADSPISSRNSSRRIWYIIFYIIFNMYILFLYSYTCNSISWLIYNVSNTLMPCKVAQSLAKLSNLSQFIALIHRLIALLLLLVASPLFFFPFYSCFLYFFYFFFLIACRKWIERDCCLLIKCASIKINLFV